MARATEKTVLFIQVKNGNKITQHPVAVFANESIAGDYARAMHEARAKGDAKRQVELWPGHPLAEDGAPLPTARFARVPVAYNPSPSADVSDLFEEDSSAAS